MVDAVSHDSRTVSISGGALVLSLSAAINLPLILSIQDTSFSELVRKGILFRSRRIKERLELVKIILIEGPDPYVIAFGQLAVRWDAPTPLASIHVKVLVEVDVVAKWLS